MSAHPIGIFDSGIGGTSIWKEIQTLMPSENVIYLADSANAPYGEKTAEQILALSTKNTELLRSHECKLIVVACNTATTNAIAQLRDTYEIPFIGIEPAIKPAALNTATKIVGVLATKGTLGSTLFHSTAKNHASNITIVEQEGAGLVRLIEEGKVFEKETEELLKGYLQPMLDARIDYLVLGCTHYPYLIPILKKLLPEHVRILDSGEAVARQTKKILEKHRLLNRDKSQGKHLFYTNGSTEILAHFLQEVPVPVSITYMNF